MLLHVTQQGTGAPVCLLHGLFGRLQNFGVLARTLAATHLVVALDLRNHGASPHAPGMAYADMAADVLATLAALDVLPATLLGHSMGGKVAMAAALTAPHAVTGLVVADIAPVTYRHANAGVAAALRALKPAPGLDRRSADAALAAAVPDSAVRAFLLQNLAFGAAPRWKIGLEEIAAAIADIEGWPEEVDSLCYDGPALFITGGRSDYVAPASWPAIVRLFPQARPAMLPGAGHWLHADDPAGFAAYVLEFLQAGARL